MKAVRGAELGQDTLSPKIPVEGDILEELTHVDDRRLFTVFTEIGRAHV